MVGVLQPWWGYHGGGGGARAGAVRDETASCDKLDAVPAGELFLPSCPARCRHFGQARGTDDGAMCLLPLRLPLLYETGGRTALTARPTLQQLMVLFPGSAVTADLLAGQWRRRRRVLAWSCWCSPPGTVAVDAVAGGRLHTRWSVRPGGRGSTQPYGCKVSSACPGQALPSRPSLSAPKRLRVGEPGIVTASGGDAWRCGGLLQQSGGLCRDRHYHGADCPYAFSWWAHLVGR